MSKAAVHVACDPAAVASARAGLRSALAAAGTVPVDRQHDAALVLSELLANAMRHAAPLPDGRFHVAWRVAEASVQISVSDGGGASEPTLGDVELLSTSGRGLGIVHALADRWWRESRGTVRTVHAVLAW